MGRIPTRGARSRIARAIVRYPVAILLVGLVAAVLSTGYGASAPQHLKGGGFLTADAESSVATGLLGSKYHVGQPNFYVLLTAETSVDDPAVKAVADEIIGELNATPGLAGLASYWTSPDPIADQMRSTDGRRGLIGVQVLGSDSNAPAAAAALEQHLSGTREGVQILCGGYALIGHQIDAQAQQDLILAEMIAIPITAVILIWAFGSLIASMVPLMIGLFAVATSFATLRILAMHLDVSIFALNMTTALSFALAIDYSLLMVTRFREELEAGHDSSEATFRTIRSAGRTVIFSAVTVGCGLAALVVFPQYFLRSFAYAGLCVVAASALASVILVPAALRLIGTRINALDLRRVLRRRPRRVERPEESPWYRLAVRVSRRPGSVAAAVVAILLLLGSPFLNVQFGVPDDRVIADSSSSRLVGDVIRAEFPLDPAAIAVAIMPDYAGTQDELSEYALRLSRVEGIDSVISAAGAVRNGMSVNLPPGVQLSPDLLFIQSAEDPYSQTGADQLRQLRDVPSPAPVGLAGVAAANVDVVDSLFRGLPTAAALMALATFVLLVLFTGSVILPIKAIVLNALSLTASFGAMVWIFQDGHLAGLLGVTATGYIVPAMPILMFCLAFGISMDYEVFVLSRIREEWLLSDRTAEANSRSVAIGIAKTGRIVTIAAVLMAIVFSAMVASRISMMQLFGLGLAVMALTDALIVRSLLVPAVMQFLGRWNWWPSDRKRTLGHHSIYREFPPRGNGVRPREPDCLRRR